MKNFIKDVLFFFLFICIFYPIMICLWGEFAPSYFKKNLNYQKGAYGSTYLRYEEIKNIEEIDILFLGSSHSYRGFDPRIIKQYGFSSFNLGTSGQSMLQTEILTKRFINILNPKLVVIEVYPGAMVTDGIESTIDIIANIPIDRTTVELALSQKNMKVFNSLIFGIYKQTFFEKEKVNFESKSEDTYISGGYNESKLKFWKENEDLELKHWKINSKQFEAFNRLVEFLKFNNYSYILVQAPVTKALNNSITNNNIYDFYMSKKGIYYNFNHLISLNDSLHFYDDNHLNQKGVSLFNKSFAEIILNNH